MDLFEYCWVSSNQRRCIMTFSEVSELFNGSPCTSTTDSIRIRPPGAGTANRPDVLHRISLCVVCTSSNLEKIGQTGSQPSVRWLFSGRSYYKPVDTRLRFVSVLLDTEASALLAGETSWLNLHPCALVDGLADEPPTLTWPRTFESVMSCS